MNPQTYESNTSKVFYYKLNASLKLFTNRKSVAHLQARFENSSKHTTLLLNSSITYFRTLIMRKSHQKMLYHDTKIILNHICSKF